MAAEKKSFTLIEIIAAMAIAVTLTTAVTFSLKGTLDAWQKAQNLSELTHRNSLAAHWLEKEIKEAQSVEYLNSQQINLVLPGGREISYHYDSSQSTLYRRQGFDSGSPQEPVARGLTHFQLSYFSNLGEIEPDTSQHPHTGVDPLQIPDIQLISLALRSSLNNDSLDLRTGMRLKIETIPYLVARFDSENDLKGLYFEIQPAIDDANDGDQIRVRGQDSSFSGYFEENLTIRNKSLTLEGGYNPDFTQSDPQGRTTVVDGQAAGSVIEAETSDGEVITISGFTFQNGHATRGGGIYIEATASSEVNLFNNNIINNVANIYGGGIYALVDDDSPGSSTINIQSNTIRGNFGGSGNTHEGAGGVYARALRGNSNITLSGNTIEKNRGQGWFGGGVAALVSGGNSSIVLEDNVITDNKNTVGHGGGIFAKASAPFGSCPDYGGATFNNNSSSITIKRNRIDNNQTPDNQQGGGIYARVAEDSYRINITDENIITENYSRLGGGIFIKIKRTDENIESTIDNNIIDNNSAKTMGAGIYAFITGSDSIPDSSDLRISNNTIINNTGRGQGGGIRIQAHTRKATAILSGNNIKENTTTGWGGGIYALALYGSASIIISDNDIHGNTANGLGGGVYASAARDSVSFQILNNTITKNKAIGFDQQGGGGVYARIRYDSASATVSGNTLSNNEALTGTGGGIHMRVTETTNELKMYRNDIHNNISDRGGGIYAQIGINSLGIISKNKIAGNTANNRGGGIFSHIDIGCSLNITNSIIAGNTAANHGGGIDNNLIGLLTVRNTHVVENTAPAGAGIYGSTHIPANIVNSIIYFNNDDSFHSFNGNIIYSNIEGGYDGDGNIDQDPLFIRHPQENDGSWSQDPSYNENTYKTTLTDSSANWDNGELAGKFLNPSTDQSLQFVIDDNTSDTIVIWGNISEIAGNGSFYRIYDYRLQEGSPCINAGTLQGAPDEDIEGTERPIGDAPDMGAYEMPSGSSGDNLIDNGNFGTGNLSNWNCLLTGHPGPGADGGCKVTDQFVARIGLGTPNGFGTLHLKQTFALPSDVNQIDLSWAHKTESHSFAVSLNDDGGNNIYRGNGSSNGEWQNQTKTIDVSNYAGQEITLSFSVAAGPSHGLLPSATADINDVSVIAITE